MFCSVVQKKQIESFGHSVISSITGIDWNKMAPTLFPLIKALIIKFWSQQSFDILNKQQTSSANKWSIYKVTWPWFTCNISYMDLTWLFLLDCFSFCTTWVHLSKTALKHISEPHHCSGWHVPSLIWIQSAFYFESASHTPSCCSPKQHISMTEITINEIAMRNTIITSVWLIHWRLL